MTIRLTGLPGCNSCRRARAALAAAGKAVEFRDVRADPPDRAELEALLARLGPALVNRQSATWRSLSKAERAGDPLVLLLAHPTLMKRPLLEGEGRLTLGWSAGQQRVWLG